MSQKKCPSDGWLSYCQNQVLCLILCPYMESPLIFVPPVKISPVSLHWFWIHRLLCKCSPFRAIPSLITRKFTLTFIVITIYLKPMKRDRWHFHRNYKIKWAFPIWAQYWEQHLILIIILRSMRKGHFVVIFGLFQAVGIHTAQVRPIQWFIFILNVFL